MFSCECSEIFKNAFFTEHLRATASECNIKNTKMKTNVVMASIYCLVSKSWAKIVFYVVIRSKTTELS